MQRAGRIESGFKIFDNLFINVRSFLNIAILSHYSVYALIFPGKYKFEMIYKEDCFIQTESIRKS